MRQLPPFDLPGGSKTLTVSPYGNVVMINQDYDLLYSDLRNEGSARVPRELPVDCSGWDREFKDGKFNNLEFNSEGNILLVWSENSIGFLAIPTKNAPDGSFNDSMMAINPCPFCELLSDNDVAVGGLGVIDTDADALGFPEDQSTIQLHSLGDLGNDS